MQGIRTRGAPTSSTGATSRRARPASRSPSTCPTQTGYDPDHELARGEVGKVGVSIAHEGDMRTLLEGIPLDQMNTSMTINATAAWLLALYIVAAENQDPPIAGVRPPGHHPERHPQGVPEPGHLLLPARPVDAPDRRHDRLHGPARPQVEPDQHLLLPPPGGRGHAGPGDRLRDEQRDRRARRRPRARARGSSWAACSGGSPSSSTPACASSRSTPSCARCPSCGTSWAARATTSRTTATAASATASRSTRWA